MNPFKQTTINGKLTLLTMLISTVALALACTVFIAYDFHSSRNDLVFQLKNMTEVIGMSLEAPLEFNEPEYAAQVLKVFDNLPHVRRVVVYGAAGDTLTQYVRPEADSLRPGAAGSPHADARFLTVEAPIKHHQRVVGSISVEAKTDDLYARLRAQIGVSLIFLVLAPALALLLTHRFKRLITEPITNLVGIARQVSKHNDFGKRAAVSTDGEVGELIESFNTMLDQLHRRDSHLRQAQRELAEYAAKLEVELSERKRTSEELSLLQAFADASGLGLGIADFNGITIYANRALENMLGLHEDESPVGNSIDRFYGGEWRQLLLTFVIPAVLKRNHWVGEVELTSVDGRRIPTLQNAFMVRGDDGQPLHIAAVITDISELKIAQEQLRSSQERLMNAQRFAQIGSWEMNLESKMVWGSDEAYKIYGIEKNSPYFPFEHTEAMVHPEDRERKDEAFRRLLDYDEPYDIEYRIKREGDGAERIVHSKAMVARDSHGNPTRAEGIIQDVTERRRAVDELYHSRQMLQLVLNNIPQRVFWKARDLTYLGCNRQFAADAGMRDPLEIIGKTDMELPWAALAGQYRAIDEQVMLDDKAVLNLEDKLIRADGVDSWRRYSKIPLHDRTGNVIGVLGSYDDVTEARKADEHRRTLQEKLERAERMESLGILAGGVAHDLNNMLGPLVGYPELILRKLPDDSPIRKQVQRIGRSAQEAADVIQDLLTLARRGRYEMVPTNLNDVIHQYLESPSYTKACERNPGVEVTLELDETLGSILGSTSHLMKVIMNLIINAFDAMPDGGRLVISTRQHFLEKLTSGHDRIANGDYAMLSVKDNGMGIDPADIQKIFEPYYSKKKMGSSGSGLGLSVVYGIVKDHKGYYDVLSRKGEGTEFILYFPITTEVIETGRKERLDLEGRETILVVDDVEEQRDIARELLSSLGYQVHTAVNGRAAVDLLRSRSVDLVVLDMIMENDFDGLDTYRAILEIHPGQKAIIVSGFSATDRLNETLRLGAGQYVKKPYTLDTIGAAIRRELNGPRKSETPTTTPV